MKQTNPTLINKFMLLISASLKGFSQVILVDNAVSGFLILIGISLYSPFLGLMAFLSSLVGTITAQYCGGDRSLIYAGIYSFNSVLSGIAVILFLTGNHRWVLALIAAAIASLSIATLGKWFAKWGIPILTIPFVFITWIGLIVANSIDWISMDPGFTIRSSSESSLPIQTLLVGLIKGIGEVFVIDSLWTGLLILVGLFLAGWRFGVYAVIGTFVSWLTAYISGVDSQSLNLGLYNYNAVLTIIAVSLVFDTKTEKTPLTGIIAAILTVPVTEGLESLLDPLGLPVLTFPFILCTWLFIAARKFFPKI